MVWESVEAFQKALEADGPKILGDIPNYTKGTALILGGAVVSSG